VLALAATASLVWANGGLVSYWPLDGTASDVVNGNHGTVYGDPTYNPTDKAPVPDNVASLSLDGSNDYVRIPFAANLDFRDAGAAFTASAWINPDNLSGLHVVFQQGQDAGQGRTWLATSGNKVTSYLGTGSIMVQSTTTLTTGNWYHVAITTRSPWRTVPATI